MPYTPPRSWEEHEERLRSDWERSYPNTPWNDVRYGYRYGWESASDPRYADRDWNDLEYDLRGGWNEWQASQRAGSLGQQIQQSWDELKESVRHGWERARREVDTIT